MKMKSFILAVVWACLLSGAAITAAEPKFRGALTFNGTQGYVAFTTSVIPSSGDFTVEFWANCPTAPSTYREILSQGGPGNAFYVGTDIANTIRLGDGWTTGVPFPIGGWHHFAVVKTATSTILYLDGTNRISKASAIPNPASGGTALRFGAQYISAPSEFWRGSLAEVRIWNTARAASGIATNRFSRLNGTEPGLLSCWQFSEETRGVCTSIGSLRADGTLFNGVAPTIFGVYEATWWMNGGNPMTHEWGMAFVDPGATLAMPVVKIAATARASYAVKSDGAMVGWGSAYSGQLNIPAAATNIMDLAAGNLHVIALKTDGSLIAWGGLDSFNFGQSTIPPAATNVVAISAGGYHSMALKRDGTILDWGDNSFGQSNFPDNTTNVIGIAAGWGFGMALKSGDSIVAWGDNEYGALNVPASATNVIAIAAGDTHGLALRADGTVVAWGGTGNADKGQTRVPEAATNVIAIAAKSLHSMALKADGTVLDWGANDYGVGNVPASATHVVAIATGGDHDLALKADGTGLGWGSTFIGETNFSPTLLNPVTPTVTGAVNTNVLGSYELTYTATNSYGNTFVTHRTVVVSDTTPPVMALNGNPTEWVRAGSQFDDLGATAADACAGNLTSSIVVTGNLNTNQPGNYTLTYSATDPSGNRGLTNRTVMVVSAPLVANMTSVASGANPTTGALVMRVGADINPSGLDTTVYFQYGLSTAYPGNYPPLLLPGGFSTTNLAVLLDGFPFGTTFHWRLVASNSMGMATSPDQMATIPTQFRAGDLNGDGLVDASELNAVLSNYWPHSPWLNLINVSGLGGTNITFALTNSIAGAFDVEYSTDLSNWTFLGPATPRYEFTDTNAPSQPRRYYRLRAK